LVHLAPAVEPSTKGVAPSLADVWNDVDYVATEGLWVLLGIALLYGIVWLGRRRSYSYSSDLVGLATAGLLLGALLRFSGALTSFYDPERAAIITAILLATPATMLLDDLVSRRTSKTASKEVVFTRASLTVMAVYVAVLIVGAAGLATLLVGGQAPGSLSAKDVNVDNFTVSTPELATATWLEAKVKNPSIVQADLHGQLVLLSEPGDYDLIGEIMPRVVDKGAYIYLSQINLADNISQADAGGGDYSTAYRSNIRFFNKHFYVVYSTGHTRVYH
jgi:uncharacterized membrane protein